jgi:glycine hydroxymethyltransferase
MYYSFIAYGILPESFEIDYDDILQKALAYKPAMIIAGFSAYPKSIHWEKFAEIAKEVERIHGYKPLLMADIAHIA